jgi:hypothetical protein
MAHGKDVDRVRLGAIEEPKRKITERDDPHARSSTSGALSGNSRMRRSIAARRTSKGASIAGQRSA